MTAHRIRIGLALVAVLVLVTLACLALLRGAATGSAPAALATDVPLEEDAGAPDAGTACAELDRRGLRQLAGILRGSRHTGARRRAAEALGHADRAECFRAGAALLDAAEDDASSEVRAAAARTLGRVGDTSALPILERAATTDSDDAVRAAAAAALVAIHARHAPPASSHRADE